MSALLDIIPAQGRKYLYAAYALVGLILGATQVGFLAAGDQPLWLTIALAVYGFIGTGIGATASVNTPNTKEVTSPVS